MKPIFKMMLISATGLCSQTFQFSPAQAPPIQWQKALGGSGDDKANAVQQTNDGGYIAAGYSKSNNGNLTGHHGSLVYADIWLTKLSADGNLQWQKNYGGTNEDVASDIKQTNDGGYVIAGYTVSNDGDISGNHGSDDVWVLKVDNTGNLQWQKTYGGSDYDAANSIQQTPDGGYILACTSASVNGDVTNNHGGDDLWIIKLNANGNITWQKTFGGFYGDGATSAQQTTDGGYIVSGWLRATIEGPVTDDFLVLKLDANGNKVWQKTYGGSKRDVANSIKQASDGGYIVAGYTYSNDGNVTGIHGNQPDYWVIKIDSKGVLQWQKTLGGTQPDKAFNVSVAEDGSYLVAGIAYSNDGDVTGNHGNYEAWVANLSNAGSLTWQSALGGTNADGAIGIQQSKDGGYVVAAYSGSNNGNVSGNHGGLADFWIVKLKKANSSSTISRSIIPQNADNTFKVFQKAGQRSLSIQLSFSDNSITNKNVLISVMNMEGQIIASKKSELVNGSMEDEIQLSKNYSPGIYKVTAVLNNKSFQQTVFLK